MHIMFENPKFWTLGAAALQPTASIYKQMKGGAVGGYDSEKGAGFWKG